jgi:histidinol phosphatase-like PHP family hydrolase
MNCGRSSRRAPGSSPRYLALLHGTELNIAPDGSVDWDADFLSGFDVCVASVQTEDPIPKHMNLQVSATDADGGVGACGTALSRRRHPR